MQSGDVTDDTRKNFQTLSRIKEETLAVGQFVATDQKRTFNMDDDIVKKNAKSFLATQFILNGLRNCHEKNCLKSEEKGERKLHSVI